MLKNNDANSVISRKKAFYRCVMEKENAKIDSRPRTLTTHLLGYTVFHRINAAAFIKI